MSIKTEYVFEDSKSHDKSPILLVDNNIKNSESHKLRRSDTTSFRFMENIANKLKINNKQKLLQRSDTCSKSFNIAMKENSLSLDIKNNYY
jgi:hypothetical protein